MICYRWNDRTDALMLGVLMLAIVHRTGSIVPAIAYHWLWNLALNFIPAPTPSDPFDRVKNGDGSSSMSLLAIGVVGVIIFQLPNLIYALYLLRKTAKEEGALAQKANVEPQAAVNIRSR